jgi:zinc protease
MNRKRFLILFFVGIITLPIFGSDTISMPPVSEFITSNGVKVFYIHDDLPRTVVTAMVATGYLYENENRAGITDCMTRELSFSGTVSLAGKALDERIDVTGAVFSVRPDWESVSVSYQTLSDFADDAFSVTGGILAEPAFSAEYFAVAKRLVKERIKREKEDPMMAAYLPARKMIFGSSSYGIRATENSVDALTLDDLKEYWKHSVKSENVAVAVASSLSFDEVKKRAERAFGKIPYGKRDSYVSDMKMVRSRTKELSKKVFFIPRDIPQTTILFLAPGTDLHDKSIDALSVADQILGGGDFNSKLIREIREKRGLAYSAGSIIRSRDATGIFMAYAQCDGIKTQEVLSLMNRSIDEMRSGTIDGEELDLAKKSLIRSYIFEFDDSLSVLSKYLSLWYTKLPLSFVTEYQTRVEKVSVQSLSSSFSKLLGDGYVTVIVGRGESVKGISFETLEK